MSANLTAIESSDGPVTRVHRLFSLIVTDTKAAHSALREWLTGEKTVSVPLKDLKSVDINAGSSLEIVLPTSSGLSQSFEVPKSGTKHLRAIVENKIRQLTPFEPSELVYAFEKQATANNTVQVTFAAVPKSSLVKLEVIAQEKSLAVKAVRLERGPAIALDTTTEGRPNFWRAPHGKLVLLNLLLGAILLSTIYVGGAVKYIGARMDRADAVYAVKEVVAARREVQKIAASAQSLKNIRMNAPDAVWVLNSIAAQTNDQTWLESVIVSRKGLEIKGYSDDAATVLSQIDALDGYSNATFKASVVRDARTGKERFHIVADRHYSGKSK